MKLNKILIGGSFLAVGYLVIKFMTNKKPTTIEKPTVSLGQIPIPEPQKVQVNPYEPVVKNTDIGIVTMSDGSKLDMSTYKPTGDLLDLSNMTILPPIKVEMPNAEEFANIKFPPLLSLEEFTRQLNMPTPQLPTP